MLSPKKKISKKEIKHDPLISAYDQATAFYAVNKKRVSVILWSVLAVVVLVYIYSNNRRNNNEKAAAELGKVFSIYDAGANDSRQYKLAIEGQPERGIIGLKSIVDNWGSTESGELARFYLASAYYATGQYDDALKQFDSFSSGNSLLKSSSYAGMARCYEVRSDYAHAASYFAKAADAITDAAATPEYLTSAARCYGLGGDKGKALEILKRLKKEFPTSTFAREADRYISQFSA